MVILLLFVACGSRPQLKETTPYGQKLLLSDSIARFGGADTIRFGQMHEGEIAEKPLQLVNEGKTPLVIRAVERTCGCTTLDYENEPLMPSETRQLTLRFDGRGEWGWQLKLMRLYLNNEPDPLRLYVEAEIE